MKESVFAGKNRYRVLRLGREYINRVANKHGAVERGIYMNIDNHIVDQIITREFPPRVFEIIVGRLLKHHQEEIIQLADMPNDERPRHINVYGNMPDSPYMVGITVNRAANGKVYINPRTCYKERNSKNRERQVSTYKIRVKTSDELDLDQ